MEIVVLASAFLLGLFFLKARYQNQRIALLGHYLGQFRIEKLMETVTDGYLRALGEADPERRAQVWGLMQTAEQELADQLDRFVTAFAGVDPARARISRLPVALPYADSLFPALTFDLRQALRIHADGVARLVGQSSHLSHRDRAFMLSAELFLLQHTCHWYCRSQAIASTRLVMRHQTTHAQVLAAVSPRTREAYRVLAGV